MALIAHLECEFELVKNFVNKINTFIFFIFIYCCTVHFDNIEILFTNKCTLLLNT